MYRRESNAFITEKTILFQGSRGVQHFPVGGGGGGPASSRGGGVQILISIESNITCDFPGGGSGPPLPPMDPHINTVAVILIETGF